MSRYLAPYLALVFLLLALACGAYGVSRKALSEAESRFAARTAESLALKERLERTIREEPLIRQHILEFEALRRLGLVGPEQRLAWSEALKKAQDELELQEAGFSLGPSQTQAPQSPQGLRQSTMVWQATLLHEGRLLALLDRLAGIESAIVWPSHCRIRPLEASRKQDATLEAKCHFEWLSLAPAIGGRP